MSRSYRSIRLLLLSCLAVSVALGCADDKRKKKYGDFCSEDRDCESGICYANACLDPDGDLDGDGLKNGVEKNLLGTDPGRADTDGDGVPDGEEVGDINAPNDRDGDGIIDALESRLMTADADGDCIPDEYDPENNVYTNDMALLVEIHCALPGVCEAGRAAVKATCIDGVPQCDFSEVPGYEAQETTCDDLDNDCDGATDEGLERQSVLECPTQGVCGAEQAVLRARCTGGEWVCDFDAIPNYQAVETACDGLDNNCDGETDEGLAGGSCQVENEHGTCTGVWVCDLETKTAVCDAAAPQAEICDGLDNNCDGQTDEGLVGEACEVENDFGTCVGTWACDLETKEAVCDAATPEAEICDGVDNNCDGQTDEGLVGEACEITNMFGSCPGFSECDIAGHLPICVAPTPAFDECDGVDNDCNGTTDDNDICDKRARIVGRVLGMPQTLQGPWLKAATAGQPIAGARIIAAMDGACSASQPPMDAPDVATTYEDGSFILPVTPGYWCLFIQAEGWESMVSWTVPLLEGDVFPVELILTPTPEDRAPLSVCGRVVASVTQDRGIFLEAVDPIAGAEVTLKQPNVELGNTLSDENGFFCISGVFPEDATGALMLVAQKTGYFTEIYRFEGIERNVLLLVYLFLEAEPTEFSTCLMDDFESGSTDVRPATAGSGYWEPSQHIGGAGWNQTWYSYPANALLGTCADLPSDESCTPGKEGCAVCQTASPQPGCIWSPGSLPRMWSGVSGWYFGNLELGAYLPIDTKCAEEGPVVSGTLASPWFNGWRVADMRLDFKSAWEVESFKPEADQLLVEAQLSSMSELDEWVPVGSLKPKDVVSSENPTMAWSSGGVDRAPVWQSYSFDLSPVAGEWMRLRFRFDSVDGHRNAFRGWLIDDIAVTGRGCYKQYVITR